MHAKLMLEKGMQKSWKMKLKLSGNRAPKHRQIRKNQEKGIPEIKLKLDVKQSAKRVSRRNNKDVAEITLLKIHEAESAIR